MQEIRAAARPRSIGAAMVIVGGLAWGTTTAIEVRDLEGFESLYGRYAPAGDCGREPRITVDSAGFSFEVNGSIERVLRPEYAASYGGDFYEGISQWFFPYRDDGGFPILLTFNHAETPGRLVVEGHDAGWPGGPPLSTREAVLVGGSPYAKCP